MFTFVIPAHNEEGTVAEIVGQALAAAQDGDRVLVVDSGSSDGTAERAREAGAEVLRGPLGKGAAMNAAIATVRTEWTCFLDADLVTSQHNVAVLLREAAAGSAADHVIGDYEYDYPGTILASTFTIYEPLTSAFFPEVGFHGANALTGYRAVRTRFLRTPLPADFGVESYLNISIALSGGRTSICHLGEIGSRYRFHGGSMATEIGSRILDMAQAHDRLDPADRPDWDRWLQDGVAAIAPTQADHGRSAILARLFTAVRRPMPAGVRTDV
ncbi:glycosyltransferase [Streptomyces sp. NBC_01275]|uniref:glycosyltransferase family 2 protein n=1 Tax=Streptomyces sp. NBC_01275 TaxID=2903807 RepID=UPI0022557DF8|nr:glycosyltransferase [Streptomyces sp. NBC_01275]MCX4762027.1 glycosyltransferase [Streptomyces sp. NBC_01275]